MSMGPPGEKLGAILPLTCQLPDVGASEVVGTRQGLIVLPFDCELDAVYAAGDVDGSSDPTVDLYSEDSGASVLTGSIALVADNEAVAGTVLSTDKQFAAGSILSVRVTTAADGSLNAGSVSIVVKKLDMTFGDSD